LGFSGHVNNDNLNKTTTMNLAQIRSRLLNRTITWIGEQEGFTVIVLDDGTRYAISADEEMNYGGTLIKLK
jgi:hypothetical protein